LIDPVESPIDPCEAFVDLRKGKRDTFESEVYRVSKTVDLRQEQLARFIVHRFGLSRRRRGSARSRGTTYASHRQTEDRPLEEIRETGDRALGEGLLVESKPTDGPVDGGEQRVGKFCRPGQ